MPSHKLKVQIIKHQRRHLVVIISASIIPSMNRLAVVPPMPMQLLMEIMSAAVRLHQHHQMWWPHSRHHRQDHLILPEDPIPHHRCLEHQVLVTEQIENLDFAVACPLLCFGLVFSHCSNKIFLSFMFCVLCFVVIYFSPVLTVTSALIVT